MEGVRSKSWYFGWSLLALLSTVIALYALWMAVKPEPPAILAESPYPAAMLAHFLGAGLALALGPWQFLSTIRRHRPALHRWSGRLYGLAMAVGSGAAVVLAPVSKGGLPAHLGFLLLALASLLTTALGIAAARRGQMKSHRQWMVRSFALAFAAVTLRLQIPLSLAAGIGFEIAYPVIAWTCWVPNLVVAEWILGRKSAD